MAIENLTNSVFLDDLINQMSSLTTFIQAIGGLILFYIVFNTINMIINRKKKKQLEQLGKDVNEIKKILRKKK